MTASKLNWIYLTLEAKFDGWAGDIRESESLLPAYWKIDYVRYYRPNPRAPAIELFQMEPIRLGNEDGKVFQVNLKRGTFVKSLSPQSWSVENLPEGVSIGEVKRVDDQHIQITLKGNSSTPTSKAEIIDVTVIAEKGEVAGSDSLLIATRGLVLSQER
jgi:hypothetical protein